MADETELRLFVSSPGDVQRERDRVDAVVAALDDEYAGRVRIRAIRWETAYYSSHDTFQAQIPEAADCDLVVAIFGARLGSPLPDGFPAMANGERYPSGSAYEVLSAMEARRLGRGIPDIYVFRRPDAPLVALDASDRAEIETQWRRLTDFFETWFRSRSGEFLAAFQEFRTTDEFAAKIEDCLRQWLVRRGFPPLEAKWDRSRLGSPYPGLAAFDEAHRAVFFGRDVVVEQILRRLRELERSDAEDGERLPFLLLIGASGSGKSSVLGAGLLPKIDRPGVLPEIDLWRIAVTVPGPDPFGDLAEALLADGALGPELAATPFRDRALLTKQLAADPDLAAATLHAALAGAAEKRRVEAGFETARPARLFLAIDQSERLFVEASAETQRRFAALIATLCREKIATVFLVLRSDAYPRFQAIEDFVTLRAGGATLDLVPPTPSELEEMATGPAALSSPPLVFERRDGRSLASVLVADARGGDALPLLQMTLARLAAAEAARGDGTLRFSDYHGLGEAVSRTAEEALADVDTEARAALPDLIVGLVRDYATDPASGQTVPLIGALDRGRFEAGRPARAALVESFVAHRLLTAEGDAAERRVRPTHESLLRIWPEAVAILEEAAHLVRARAAIEPLARDWAEAAEADKARHLDVSPALLEAAVAYVRRFGDEASPTTVRFVEEAAAVAASRREAERRDRERRIADAEAIARANRRIARTTGLGLAAALVLAAAAGWQWHLSTLAREEAQVQRDRAERALTAATATANGLVFDLAQKFRDVSGVPRPLVKDMLDQARRLQEQLLGSGESSTKLTADHAAALGESASAELSLGDVAKALDLATAARTAYAELNAAHPEDPRWIFDLAHTEDLVGNVLDRRGEPAEAEAAYGRAQAVLEVAMARGIADPRLPQRLASVLQDRGRAAQERGDTGEALARFGRSLDLSQELSRARPDDLALRHDIAVGHRSLGDVLLESGALDEADRHFAAASEIAAALAREHPENSLLQRDFTLSQERLGLTLMKKGDFAGARRAFSEGEATALAMAKTDPANLEWQYDVAIGHREIGDAERAAKDLAGALLSFRAALAIDEVLVAKDPGNETWRRHHDDVQQRLALTLAEAGDEAGALATWREVRTFAGRALEAAPTDREWLLRAFEADVQIGGLLTGDGDGAAARAAFESALATARRLPQDRLGRRQVAAVTSQIAGVATLDGAAVEAVALYGEAETALRALMTDDPKDAATRAQLALARVGEAHALRRLGRVADAAAGLREAIALAEALAAETPNDPKWPRELVAMRDRLGDALAEAGDATGAITAYRASLAGTAGEALAGAATREALAPLLEAEKQPAEALAVVRDAVAIRRRRASEAPGDAANRRALLVDLNLAGRLQAAGGAADDGLALYREGLGLARDLAARAPADVEARHDLALSLFLVGSQSTVTGDADGALAALSESLPIALDLERTRPQEIGFARFAAIVARTRGAVRLGKGDRAGALEDLVTARDASAAALALDPARSGAAAELAGDVGRIGLLANELLLSGAFAPALAAIDEAKPIGPGQSWIDLVRGATLMFLGRTAEAETTLARHRGETAWSGRPWEREVLDAMARLRAKGLVHPFMKEIEAKYATP